MGIRPESWSVADVITLQLFRTWKSSTNWREELLAHALIARLGAARASEITQLTINPDDGSERSAVAPEHAPGASRSDASRAAEFSLRADWLDDLPRPDAVGSNAWAVTGRRSTSGRPILASDPHVDARRLPGFWHPVGLFTPELRAIGGGTPGTPGLGIGRTEHIAFAATNGYADVVDLFLETEDPSMPGHYLEGERSLPFTVRNETFVVRDPSAPGGRRTETLRIRTTRRGPILSDHALTDSTGGPISIRWSPAEHVASELGSRGLLLARSVEEARDAIAKIAVPLTQIVADHEGSIALVGSGIVPVRRRADGATPIAVLDEGDAWQGFIPGRRMPSIVDPTREWVGSTNHRIVPADYPYVYSTHFSHSWRYRRLRSLLEESERATVDDHWRLLRDVHNEMAERLTPILVAALESEPETASLAKILGTWNRSDLEDEVGPSIFQSVYRHFARRVFEDDLGEALTTQYLDDPYYWQERLARMVETNDGASWFDDRRTSATESRDDLIRQAAIDARLELESELGPDSSRWTWGRLHRVTFSPPVVSSPMAEVCIAGGVFGLRGSGETLNRAAYAYSDAYETTFLSSMRFVADLADSEKVTAMIPGGAVGRCDSPHLQDQLGPWLEGQQSHWWFSDRAIEDHAISEYVLRPARRTP